MIQITKLCIENFLCFGKVEVDLQGAGLVGVCGINEDDHTATSNGAGKSSLLEALYYGLYGHTIRFGKSRLAGLIRRGKQHCKVMVQFQDEHKTHYQVSRKRSPTSVVTSLKRSADSKVWADVPYQDKKDLQAQLVNILGVSADLFRQVVLFGQGGMPRFSELSDSAKKELIEEILGLHIYDRALAISREKERQERREKDSLEGKLAQFTGIARNSQETLERLRQGKGTWKREKEAKLVELGARRAKLQEGLGEEKEEARTVLENAVEVIGKEIVSRQEEIDQITAQREKALQAFQESHQELTNVKAKQDARYAFLQQEHERMDRLRFDGICPTCKRSTEGLEIEGEEDIQQALLSARHDVSQTKQRISDLEQAWKVFSSREDAKKKELGQQVREYQERLQRVQKELSLSASKEVIRRHLQDVGMEIQELRGKGFPQSELLEANEESLLKWKEKKEVLQKEIDQAQLSINRLKVLQEVFTTTRSLLLENLLGEVNQRLAEYCYTLTHGELSATISAQSETTSGEKREKVSVQVSHATGGEDYVSCSSGERRRLDLPIALALQDLAARRGLGVGLTLLDEVFENVDAAGAEGMRELVLEASQRPHSPTVLVISHNESLMEGFPSFWYVTKRDGKTQVEVS